jgi:hydrogenase maturation factor HypF (carbamoyltransferase family)
MNRFDPNRVVVATTRVWQREQDGTWSRFMIREQQGRTPVTSPLIFVPTDAPLCLSCLSTNVTIVASRTYVEGELCCHECGVRYGLVM